MDLICENEDVLRRFVGENCFLDTKIEKFEIWKKGEDVFVDVQLCMRPKSNWIKVLLRFNHCEYYALHFSNECYFYNIERLKLFISENGKFYASFDPFDEDDVISKDDNDVVCSEGIQAFKIT